MSNYRYNVEGLAENVQYVRNEDGSINWRAMIPAEHFVVNHKLKGKLETKYKKPYDQIKPTEVTDKELLILISGIKAVAKLRGFISKVDTISASTGTHAAVSCHITWMPNIETNMQTVTFGDSARACVNTTEGDFQFHLEAIASNRAFIRAVRNFLNINVVGKDEIGDVQERNQETNNNHDLPDDKQIEELIPQENPKPTLSKENMKNYAYLEELITSNNMTFESFKARAIEKHAKKLKSNPSEWTGINDSIPQRDIFYLTELLAKSLKTTSATS